jgi:hypothetical protein
VLMFKYDFWYKDNIKSFSCSNANRKEVIDHIKSSMVNLLCSLSGICCSDAEDVSPGTNGNIFIHEHKVFVHILIIYLGFNS